MVGKMHAAGLVHRDLHCGNLLVRVHDGRVQLTLMDLHRMARRRRLSQRAMAANLAQLFHDRLDFTTRTDRLRFLKHYLAALGGDNLRAWQEMVDRRARPHARRQYANRDRRIAGDGRYFTPLTLPGGWCGRAVLSCKQVLAGSRRPPCDLRRRTGRRRWRTWRAC